MKTGRLLMLKKVYLSPFVQMRNPIPYHQVLLQLAKKRSMNVQV